MFFTLNLNLNFLSILFLLLLLLLNFFNEEMSYHNNHRDHDKKLLRAVLKQWCYFLVKMLTLAHKK